MGATVNILVLGAAYGLLPAVRLGLANHRVTVVCRQNERAMLAQHGATLEFRRRDGRQGLVLHMPACEGRASEPGQLGLVSPEISVEGFDLVFLAMGEPQYAAPEIAELMGAIAEAKLPVVSLMNLLPPAFLRRLEGLDVTRLKPAYRAWDVWEMFDPSRFTAASPDAQAVRLSPDQPNRLTVTLASNFKVAPFERPEDQRLLEIAAASLQRHAPGDVHVPAQIVAHGSLAIPFAKWPMLIAGNCRCLTADGTMISISDAVRGDLDESRKVYELVARVIRDVGATSEDVVPFASYAAAAKQLTQASSLARALASGAHMVERIDLMVLLTAKALGLPTDRIEEVAAIIQHRVDINAGALAEAVR